MPEIGPAEPWCVREIGLDLTTPGLRQAESLFALANGHIGMRGNLEEPELQGMPGTYLNSLFEVRDLAYPEAGYGFPERTETVVDAPNGKIISLYVGDDPFDVRTGELLSHERTLDLRAGALRRNVEWRSPSGVTVTVTSIRLVSFPQPAVAAIRYQVKCDRPVPLRVVSDLLANEEQPEQSDDPRASATLHHPLRAVADSDAMLRHRTKRSGIDVAAAVRHVSAGEMVTWSEPDRIRCVITGTGSLRVDKILGYAWGDDPPAPELDQVTVDDLLTAQREYLDDFWETADVELDGDPEVQQGVRFGLFHVLQAGAQAGPHPIVAKGNLRGAADLAEHSDLVSADEVATWRAVADGLSLPYSTAREVHEQAAGFTKLEEWDFAGTKDEDSPLMLHFPYLDLYRKQVIKQADVVLAMLLRGDAFTAEQKARNFAYYEARTVRDSSLSAPAHAVLAAELGHLELAHDYLAEAALLDLRSSGEASGDGLHIAACAGSWIALVMGFSGMRDHDGRLSFAPRVPAHLPRLRFCLRWRDSRLRVTVTPSTATYEVNGPPVELSHHGVALTVSGSESHPIPENQAGPEPTSPRPPERRRDVLS
jgi:trehalose/maltose hydrolase-like predicted phosphorylase